MRMFVRWVLYFINPPSDIRSDGEDEWRHVGDDPEQ